MILARIKWLIWNKITSLTSRGAWLGVWLFKGRFLVGVMAIIFNEKNQVLLVQHQWHEKHLWRLPGGLVEKKGSLENNLAREIKEELGVEPKRIRLVWAEKASWQRRIDVFFLFTPQSEIRKLPPNSEIRRFRFFPLDSLPRGLFPGQKQIILLAWKQSKENLLP